MAPAEIWLRLMRVNGLYGGTIVTVARRIGAAAGINSEALRLCGLSVAQARQFLTFDQRDIDAAQEWLEQPEHHLLSANSPLYPPQLRATADYPGALLVKGDLAILQSRQLAVVGSRAHSWYGRTLGESVLRSPGTLWHHDYQRPGDWYRRRSPSRRACREWKKHCGAREWVREYLPASARRFSKADCR
ncbi:DNA protecting protein DprA [Raoultella terrigena]|uniref:DNA protecting protein DprA n=1 Tax=Raoultella terrigena TaxID=577 RepID=A0A3P8JBY3_RAOTE|nr:DNA protecting protein DprA [Raoultella terrigena]